MQDVRIAAVQFKCTPGEKAANLAKIEQLARRAADAGAEIVCFHEQSVAGYNLWGQGTSRFREDGETAPEAGRVSANWTFQGLDPYPLAEAVPGGPSIRRLMQLAGELGIILGAGIPELRANNAVYNTYFLVDGERLLGKYSKVHCVPGIEYAYFKQGNGFPVFDLGKVKVGVLICYDNHFPEAHRILAIKGAQAILMPHVTVGGSWWSDLPKADARTQARNWLLTWLRARSFDNSCYSVFVNEAGDDAEKSLGGCSMILDPQGHVIADCETNTEALCIATLSAKDYYHTRRIQHDYLNHRRPELYGELARTDLGENWPPTGA